MKYIIQSYNCNTGFKNKDRCFTKEYISSRSVQKFIIETQQHNEILLVFDEKCAKIIPNQIDCSLFTVSGFVSKCKKCGELFVRTRNNKYFCRKCHEIGNRKKICPVCGKEFVIRYQDNQCCSKSCARKLDSPFKNPEVLSKIANTNLERYGCQNPWNNKEIQHKCQINHNRIQQSIKIKEKNISKYGETRRLKALRGKSNSCKEGIIFDKLEKFCKIDTEYTYKDCIFKHILRFDFHIPKQIISHDGVDYLQPELCIEYDGEQHYHPVHFNNITDSQSYQNFISTQIKDWIKDKYCIEHDIPLVRIKPINKVTVQYDEIMANSYLIGKPQNSDKNFQCFGILDADHVNCKDYVFTIESGISCTFKCDKENHCQLCQNWALSKQKPINTTIDYLIHMYDNSCLVKGVAFQGLEPLDSLKQLLWFIYYFRENHSDPIYIWTGYTQEECVDFIYLVQHVMKWPNIIIKFGRFIPNQEPHLDEVLGVNLASDNQYARKIS